MFSPTFVVANVVANVVAVSPPAPGGAGSGAWGNEVAGSRFRDE